MKNYTEGVLTPRFWAGWTYVLFLLLILGKLNAQDTTPPFFTDARPADRTIECLSELPASVNRQADDVDDPAFPQNIAPVDTPDPETLKCSGGLILRIWEATDASGNTVRDTQRITLLPDDTPPIVDLPERRDTVYCESRNQVENDFITWVDTRQLELVFNNEDCNLDRIENNAPDDFDVPCGTQEVIFTLYDECGQSTEWRAYYTVLDTLAPQQASVPANLTLTCSDDLPALPNVVVSDNCTASNDISTSFVERSTQLMDGSCSQYEYTVLRIWTAEDLCGNIVRDTQRIDFIDPEPPTFDKPADLTISCDQDPTDFSITGEPTNIQENCGGSVNVTYQDRIIGDRANFCYDIQRTWRAVDVCGNTMTALQFISVRDTEAPTFTPPPDITINCNEGADPSVTGEPTIVSDNCDPNPGISFIDTEIAGSCENNPIINRLWRVDDACGNRSEFTQVITVVDEQAPVFTSPAADLIIACEGGVDADQAFQDWINTRGGAAATDNCSAVEALRWEIYNSGTTDAPTLPPLNCDGNGPYIRWQTVDFIVEDECGNRDTSTATFGLEDLSPPILLNCPTDTIIAAAPGDCGATFQFFAPAVEEACGAGANLVARTASAPVTSAAAPGEESDVPVDPLEIALDYTGLIPLNALGEATLTINLLGLDAEATREYFLVYGEDGAFLGNTQPTDSQCGNGETTFSIPADQINHWVADGTIRFRLEPNIPQDREGRFAINDLCEGGAVSIRLSFPGNNLAGLSLAYRLNDGARQPLPNFGLNDLRVEQGMNRITLYAIDCAANVDSCSFLVEVEDREAPQTSCPDDIERVLPADSCAVAVELPLPQGVVDNCTEGTIIRHQTPADTASAYLTFRYDPNLNDYLAEARTLTFSNVAASAISDVTLRLDFQGDFDTPNAVLELFGEDDTPLGATTVGDAACGRPGQAFFNINNAQYNQWAADGVLTLRAVPRDIPVPPGQPGDGVNPCDANAVTQDGDQDGQSYLFAELSYEALIPEFYYATGATDIPLSQMQEPAVTPTHVFNVGVTDVFYLVSDEAGNQDTCSFQVTVQDQQAPTAVCQPTRVFINPSGLQFDTIPASVIDGGSRDNCMIDTMFITPNVFSCDAAGSLVPVTLTVQDIAGNQGTCSTMVRVETLGPSPTANSGVCGGDTLFLVANPPPATGGVIYSYQWTGPNGFTSTMENPIIPGVDADNEGSYTVEVIGITGCSAVGTVEVSIRDLPQSIRIETTEQICAQADIQLAPAEIPAGNQVRYEWYEGLPPEGTLLGTTSMPAFTVAGPHDIPQGQLNTTKNFYLIIESDACRSTPSTPTTVTVSQKPVAAVNEPQIEVCEGESVSLGTPITGEGMTYEWTGPNGFSSTAQFPAAISPVSPADGGLYRLIVFRNGCPSDPVFVNVTVLPKPDTPLIFNDGPACEGGNVTLSTNVTDASVYRWISSANPDEIANNTPTLSLENLQRSDAASWRVYVTQFGCDSDLSPPTQVTVNAIPDAVASAEPEGVCEGQPLRLLGLPNIVNATYQWEGPNNFRSSMQNPVINDAQANRAGAYRLRVESPEGCVGRDTIEIDVVEASFITGISNDAPACLSGPTDITLVASVFPPDNGEYEYRWTTPGGTALPDQSAVVLRNATAAQNGVYRLEIVNDKGCVSEPAAMELQVADPPPTPPTPSPSEASPLCDGDPLTLSIPSYPGGEVEYIWRTPAGEVITTTPLLDFSATGLDDNGPYSVIAKVNGCESAASNPLNLQVNPVPVITAASNGPVCSGSLIDLSVTEVPGAVYTWTGPGFSSSLRNPKISQADSALHAGTYKVAAILNGCVSNIDSVELVVKPRPDRPAAVNGGAVCIDSEGASLPLEVLENSATPGATYHWTDAVGNAIGSTPDLTFTLSDFDDYRDGTYSFLVRAELDGCFSSASAPTNVMMSTIPAISASAGQDTIVCEGEIFTLEGNTPGIGTGLWSWVGEAPAGVTIDSPEQANSTVTGLMDEGNYTLRWTLSRGACQAYDLDEVTLTVKPLIIPYAGEDQLACASETVTLEAEIPMEGTGRWLQSEVQALLGVEIEDPNDPQTAVQGLEPGNLYSFTWNITEGCGNMSDEVLILISDPNPDAGRDSIICNDDAMTQLNAAEPAEGSFGAWSSPNPELFFSNRRNPQATLMDLHPGENILVWTIDEGICGDLSRDTLRLFYKQNPIARPEAYETGFGEFVTLDLLANDFAPPDSFVVIVDEPNHGRVEEQEDGSLVYIPDFDFVGTDQFTYALCSDGCECSEAVVTLTIGEDAGCDIPSIITPNGDEINDLFIIPCLFDVKAYPNSQLTIINQWGDEVFRSGQPYENDWGGTYDGEALPAGTYFYLLNFGNGEPEETGFVIIYR